MLREKPATAEIVAGKDGASECEGVYVCVLTQDSYCWDTTVRSRVVGAGCVAVKTMVMTSGVPRRGPTRAP